jgi:hypothetical protein
LLVSRSSRVGLLVVLALPEDEQLALLGHQRDPGVVRIVPGEGRQDLQQQGGILVAHGEAVMAILAGYDLPPVRVRALDGPDLVVVLRRDQPEPTGIAGLAEADQQLARRPASSRS